MVREDLKPSKILTRAAFENAIAACTAIGGSTNCPPHITAIARHAGVALEVEDWQRIGYELPLLVDCQPAGQHLGEGFHLAGGLPAVMKELLDHDKLKGEAFTCTGRTMAENLATVPTGNPAVIRPYERPLKQKAGFLVLSGNLFEAAVMKTSVISESFRKTWLERPESPGVCEARAVVFEGPEDYHHRINDPALKIDANCFLFIRGVGPVGYPGAAEVVNMQPPDALLKAGVSELPTIGDGRQSGTSASPSILNASPEAAVGGGLALLQTGDTVRLDLPNRRLDLLVDEAELARRRAAWKPPSLDNQTPWQELYRRHVGQLSTGACLDFATAYQRVGEQIPRNNH
jgi:dihydroxy-acid dehydratase